MLSTKSAAHKNVFKDNQTDAGMSESNLSALIDTDPIREHEIGILMISPKMIYFFKENPVNWNDYAAE